MSDTASPGSRCIWLRSHAMVALSGSELRVRQSRTDVLEVRGPAARRQLTVLSDVEHSWGRPVQIHGSSATSSHVSTAHAAQPWRGKARQPGARGPMSAS